MYYSRVYSNRYWKFLSEYKFKDMLETDTNLENNVKCITEAIL